MKPLSHNVHNNRVQSVPPHWLTLCSGLLLGGLVGCSNQTLTPAVDVAQTHTDTTTEVTPTIDQSPIAHTLASTNSVRQQEESAEALTEEAAMTVLVLDNPELQAKAALLESHPVLSVETLEETPRRPHRLRFHYGFDKHQLNEEDTAILREHAAYLLAHPEVTVRIHGHTDSFGPQDYNTFLSRLRASAAAKLLKAEGVRESQIQVTGWGSSRPLARPEDHAANRRLELEYLSAQMAKAQ